MTSGWRLIGPIAVLAAGLATCSQTNRGDRFVGTWSYAGAINPNCQDYAPIDLTGDTVTITAPDSSHLVVDLGGFCTVKFGVDGSTANAEANQSCTFDIPGFGPASILIKKWTLTISSDDVLNSDFVGGVLICMPTGTGTLTRAGDAGTGGGTDASDDAGTD